MENRKPPDGSTFSPELSRALKEMRDATPVGTTYLWSDMEIGDSILFQADQGENLETIRTEIETSISRYSKFTGKKFSTKTMLKENGFRVWRRE